jgi:conjugative transfer signal peptidase TraF
MVLAVEGDLVSLKSDEIRLNGVGVPNSATVTLDSRGRPLAHFPWGDHRLTAGELWLFSPFRRNAYDSRYFGPVLTAQVVSRLTPLWTWNR